MNQTKVLIFIVLAQFFCTSVWFASNSVMPALMAAYSFPDQAMGWLTSAVQLGFICGTLFYAFFNLADRHSPSRVFFVSALLAALSNSAVLLLSPEIVLFTVFRFFVGFFLAGIYPVGMKIAADYFEKGLGRSLGFLVGALVLGTALPHLLRSLLIELPWQAVFVSTSVLCLIGGLLILVFVPDGPFRRPGSGVNFQHTLRVFKIPAFREAAIGYFGHMWELYTFWALVPAILAMQRVEPYQVSILSFVIIAIGAGACVLAGLSSQRWGSGNVARLSLMVSALCCLVSPFVLLYAPTFIGYLFLAVWGTFVIADSPMFSKLVASSAIPELKGSALTLVNCLGFALTIFSIQLLDFLKSSYALPYLLPLLAIGPVVGLLMGPKYSNLERKQK
ncbi:MFS transporter [Reichenbachiella ulvae]|uniref:MFS transporter n=1 Tax=Reichenbachiella ulvae TaxID=2980104 RepID=A0ABT3D0A6_9BACT|nr:MFS transporter [Reichenbachiella ulvae]MCV9389332.1 MFS transporter [Reichenbachiella ulvae]